MTTTDMIPEPRRTWRSLVPALALVPVLILMLAVIPFAPTILGSPAAPRGPTALLRHVHELQEVFALALMLANLIMGIIAVAIAPRGPGARGTTLPILWVFSGLIAAGLYIVTIGVGYQATMAQDAGALSAYQLLILLVMGQGAFLMGLLFTMAQGAMLLCSTWGHGPRLTMDQVKRSAPHTYVYFGATTLVGILVIAGLFRELLRQF